MTMISRRRFLLWGGGATISGLLGGAYIKSGCPLSDGKTCVGPCTACIDLDHDAVCDRVQRARAPDQQVANDVAADGEAAGTFTVRCPYGIVNDPYPGACRRYVDANGNGICDLSEPSEGAEAASDSTPDGLYPPDEGRAEGDGQVQRRRGRGRGGQ